MNQSDPQTHTDRPHIVIIGAGIIGLSCAWELTKRGAKVTVYDKQWPPRGASWAAAGMLAPAYEAAAEEGAHPQLFDLCMESAKLWPGFAAELEAESGIDLGYQTGPTLAVAMDLDQLSALARLSSGLSGKSVPHGLWRDEAAAHDPSLGNCVSGAITLDTDGQVDNRAVLQALARLCVDKGVLISKERPEGGMELRTIGWRDTACTPVKGQMLSLAAQSDRPAHVIRSGNLYIVPKADRTLIGATVENGVDSDHVSIERTDLLLERAIEICPALRGAPVLERWCGIRPATKDRAPLFGQEASGAYIATGHYRNGILLAPITAHIMADMILENKVSDLAATFSPQRFAPATA